MKAIFEFTLPQDRAEYDIARNATKFHDVLKDLQNHIERLDSNDPPEITTHDLKNLFYDVLENCQVHL